MKIDDETYQGLPIKHISEAALEALNEINIERGDEQSGLFSRWNGVNRGMGRMWRFNHVSLIAGMTGHGKSYTINQLHDDFTDFTDILNNDGTVFKEAINKKVKFEVVVIAFSFEMDSSDEVVRSLTRKMNKSYHYMMSSEYNKDTEEFNKIDDKEYAKIENRINYIKNKPIYYVENAGTVNQMWNTILYISKKHPNAKLVITVDHTLLVRKGNTERSDDDLIAVMAHFAISVRKRFKAMVILLGQCNQNLKSVDRITTASLHYPMDSDIYRGAQIVWACDNVLIFYRPELLNIPKYGIEQIPTKDLVIASIVKSRKGSPGDVYLKNNLATGSFTE